MIKRFLLVFLLTCSPAFAGGVHFDKSSSENLDCGDWDITGDISIEIVAEIDAFPSSDTAIESFLGKNYSAPAEGYYIRMQQVSGTDYLEVGSWDSTDGDSILQYDISGWSTGTRYNIGVTCDNATKVWKIYVDGSNVATSSAQTDCAQASAELTLGGGNSSRYGDVRLYRATIWSDVKGPEVFAQLASSDLEMLPLQYSSSLEAHWIFDEHPDGTSLNAGETYRDYSGNGHTCTESDGSPDALGEPSLTYQ